MILRDIKHMQAARRQATRKHRYRDVTTSFKESQLAPSQLVRDRQRRTINRVVAILVVVLVVSIIAVSR